MPRCKVGFGVKMFVCSPNQDLFPTSLIEKISKPEHILPVTKVKRKPLIIGRMCIKAMQETGEVVLVY